MSSSYNYYNGFIIKETVKASVDTDEIITRKIDSASYTSTTGKINIMKPINADLKDETHILNDTIKTKNINCSTIETENLNTQNISDLNTLNTDNLTTKILNATSGTITTSPTNNNDIANKSYVDNKIISSALSDYVSYDTSTKYLKNNSSSSQSGTMGGGGTTTTSNIETINCKNINVSDYINKSSVSVEVSTSGYHGTDKRTIKIYRATVNNKISIIFDKNTQINSYKWVSDISMNENGMTMDFSNLSDIYDDLPYEFYLTGQASVYGGSHYKSTRTLTFNKTSDYKYQVQYKSNSFSMNLFNLTETIKNSDTIISIAETEKINNLTINKGLLYSDPTNKYNLVNKDYTDKNFITYDNSTSKLKLNNNNIEYLDIQTANINNGSISGTLTTENLNITVGNITTSPTEDNNIVNKSYVDNAISSINDNISGENTKFIKFDDQTKTLKQNNQTLENINIKNLTGETINSTNSTLTGLLTTKQANIEEGMIIGLSATTAEIGEAEVSGNITSDTAEITKTLKVKNIECENIKITNQFNPTYNIFDITGGDDVPTITGAENSPIVSIKFLKIFFSSNLYLKIDLFLYEPIVSKGSTITINDIAISFLKINSGSKINLEVNEFFNNGTKTGNIGIINGYLSNGSTNGKYNISFVGTQSGDTIYKFTIEPVILLNYSLT